MARFGAATHSVTQVLLAFVLSLAVLVLESHLAQATISDIAGTYSGPWTDLTLGTSGAATITIDFSGNIVQFDLLLTGEALGGGLLNIPEEAFSATVVGNDIILNTPGLLSGLADLTGQISGSDGAVSVQLGNFDVNATGIDSIVATGQIANGNMHIDYTINIDPSAGAPFPSAVGTLDAALVPEPGVWSLAAVGLGLIGWRVNRRRRPRCPASRSQ